MNFVSEGEIHPKDDYDIDNENNERTDLKNTFVGTAEYVSPEVLVDQEAGPATDLWALGCIIYQMFVGCSPFKDKTEYLVFKKILEQNYIMPDSIPKDAKDLIKALLVKDPNKRLGSGIDEEDNNFISLKSHSFFNGLDFDTVNTYDAPYKNEFKSKIIKCNSSLSKHNSNSYNEMRHKNTIQVIKQDILEKKSPWFHYNTRKVVLDNTPKIEYIDPEKNLVKVIY